MAMSIHPKTIVCFILVAMLAAAGCGNEDRAGDTTTPYRWVADGRWVRDAEGRVLLLRSANYSGLEWGYFSDQPHGPAEEDFAEIASWGMTAVRLPIAWTYLEPEPNRIDLTYLTTEVDRVIDFAARHGLHVIIDMHQYNWSSCFSGGLGIPPWTCAGKYPATLIGQFRAQSDFWRNSLAPDGRPLIEHFVDVWRAVAEHYRDSPTVVAFDLFNEPLDAGDVRTKPLDQVAAEFEHNTLFPFYRRLAAVIRATGAEQTLIVEPAVTRNLGYRAHPEPIDGENVLYSPHIYLGADTGGFVGDQNVLSEQYAQALTEAEEMAAPLWVGEWGVGDANFYRYSLAAQNQFLLGSAVWGYFPSGSELVDADGNENSELVDLLVQPYPIQTAGTPLALAWDPVTRQFSYSWREDDTRRIPDPTILFVPLARHYPNGIMLTSSPGDRVTSDGERLVIEADRRNPVHTLTITAK